MPETCSLRDQGKRVPSDGDALPPTGCQVVKKQLVSRRLPGGWALEMLSSFSRLSAVQLPAAWPVSRKKKRAPPTRGGRALGKRCVRLVCSLV